MNKTAKIIISILVVLCIFFILMAQIKGNEAEKLAKSSNEYYNKLQENIKTSEKMAEKAIRQAALAQASENKAMAAQKEAMELKTQLEKCQTKK